MAKGLAGQTVTEVTITVRTMGHKAAKSVDANSSGGTRMATPQ